MIKSLQRFPTSHTSRTTSTRFKMWSGAVLIFVCSFIFLLSSSSLPFTPHISSDGGGGQRGHTSDGLDEWIDRQAEISWKTILTSISPHGALPGIIVASLSTNKPDYYYYWTRDAAITLKEIVTRWEETNNAHLLELIKQTIVATQKMQSNSRTHSTVSLGEPKFKVDGTPFLGPWGRPQRDGAGIRATVYIKFARLYMKRDGEDGVAYVRQMLYDSQFDSRSVIKADLEYVANSWKDNSFDLWEEVNGHHLFTFAVMQRALHDGISFSQQMDDPGASSWYQKQYLDISERLENRFWDIQAKYFRASENFTDSHGKSSWLDVGTLLGSLHAGPQAAAKLRPNSSQMISTYHSVFHSMSSLYPINDSYSNLTAKPIGRYPEDVYDGVSTSQGNPWFLTTLAMSEFLYRATENGTLRKMADEFVTIIRGHVTRNGSMHEEFDRISGVGCGARDLTWSHVAFLSMYRARKGLNEF